VRLSDATGSIDFKFWDKAADHFRAHEALCKGSCVRFEGFALRQLSSQQLEFAPAGRKHELICPPHFSSVKIEQLQPPPANAASGAHSRKMGLRDALKESHGACVNISSAFVVEVGDLEDKVSRDGQALSSREVWLSADKQGPALVRWLLWNRVAQDYGHKQLRGQRLSIQGARIKVFNRKKELTGCWKNGGIELLAG